MMHLHQDYDKFTEKDTVIVAVGPEDRECFGKFWEKNDFSFYGIPDPNHDIQDLYGQQVNLIKLGRMPAQILIDKSGTIRYVHYGKSMKDIPENSDILALVDSINN
jgi:peroxiredoxin